MVHYYDDKYPLQAPVLSHMNPVHILATYFFDIIV